MEYAYEHSMATLRPEPSDKEAYVHAICYSTDYDDFAVDSYRWPEDCMAVQSCKLWSSEATRALKKCKLLMCDAVWRHGDIFLHFNTNADNAKKISWQNHKVMHKWLFSPYLKHLGTSLWLYCDGNALPVSAEILDKKTFCQIKFCLKFLVSYVLVFKHCVFVNLSLLLSIVANHVSEHRVKLS